MKLSKEILIALGFQETKVNDFDMYVYSSEIGPLYIEKTHKEKEFYMVYTPERNNELKQCGHCEDLASLIALMMRINHLDSIKIGKELKQKEMKSVLGI